MPAQLAFLCGVRNGTCTVFQISDGYLPHIEELTEHYADLPMDLADASLVVLAEEMGSGRILSTDKRDFRTYRWASDQKFGGRA